MKKQKPKKHSLFRLIFICAVAGASVCSYICSEKIYSFYLKIYYKDIRHFTADNVRTKAENLFDKDRAQCASFLRDMESVFAKESKVLSVVGAMYIRLGENEKGIEALMRAVELGLPPEETEDVIPKLAKNGYFGDICALLENRPVHGYMRGYYGISLYCLGRMKEAAYQLESALAEEGDDAVLLFCLSGAYRELGDTKQALSCMERAYRLAPSNKRIREELTGLFQQNGMLRKAAELQI